jgi:hypothetical protein
MFERASKKLGLGEAIFAGKFTDKDKKPDKADIEKLLRDGAYAFLEEDAGKAEEFMESNIEDILIKNTRNIDYNVKKGSYSLVKTSFVCDTADRDLDINDPKFWEKALP